MRSIILTIAYGEDIVKITYDALASSDIAAYLKPNYAVAIKPNLVVPRPASDGATTHPEVVKGIIRFLKEYGVKGIGIIESSAISDNTKAAFKVCGYERLRLEYGVSLFNLKSDSTVRAAFLTH